MTQKFYGWIAVANGEPVAVEVDYRNPRHAERDARKTARRHAEELAQPVDWAVIDHSEDVDPLCDEGTCTAPVVARGRELPRRQ